MRMRPLRYTVHVQSYHPVLLGPQCHCDRTGYRERLDRGMRSGSQGRMINPLSSLPPHHVTCTHMLWPCTSHVGHACCSFIPRPICLAQSQRSSPTRAPIDHCPIVRSWPQPDSIKQLNQKTIFFLISRR